MTKVSIVGVEGSGKTVLMAVLGDKYKLPDANGLSLKPNNFETYSYVENQMAELQDSSWPQATTPDVMRTLGWTLQRTDAKGNVTSLGEVPFLDFAGEVYRYAFGPYTDDEIKTTPKGDLTKPVRHLREHVRSSQCLVVLVNLTHVINGSKADRRTQETVWLTQRIVEFARDARIPRVALALTQCDRYRDEIEACGGVSGTLRKYLPHVATSFPHLDVFEVSAVGEVRPSRDGAAVPSAGAPSVGIEGLMSFMVRTASLPKRGWLSKVFGLGLLTALIAGGIFIWGHGQFQCRHEEARTRAETAESNPPQTTEESFKGLYKVVDLTNGSVTHLAAVPSGGWTDEYKTSKLILRRIDPGTFTMGSPSGEEGRHDDEKPHEVTLTKPYYIGVFEVTQGQWRRVMGSNPSTYKSETRPVEGVAYDDVRGKVKGSNWPNSGAVDAESFLGWMRSKTRETCFDLPTEAQWEYACRAGTTGAYAGTLDSMAWYESNSGGETHAVGQKSPNAWGLYDMHGNVWEWCADWHGDYDGNAADPTGPASGTYRVCRVGGWSSNAICCRSAYRGFNSPGGTCSNLGFRLCCSAGPLE